MDESLEEYVIKLRNGRKPPVDEAWETHWALLWTLAKQEGEADSIIGTLPERSEAAAGGSRSLRGGARGFSGRPRRRLRPLRRTRAG